MDLDQNTFIAWSNILTEGGFKSFYNSWSDYLPGYLYVLWFLAKIGNLLPIPTEVLFKLPALISDLATGYLIYHIVMRLKGEKLGFVAASIFLFNPAVLSNSSLWGQIDSLTSLFSLLSILFFGKNIYLSAFFLSFGFMVKPQAALAAPVILFLMAKNRFAAKNFFLFSALVLIFLTLGFLPFFSGGNLAEFIIQRVKMTLGQYPYSSINAFNFWGLRGFWKSEGEGIFTTGFWGLLFSGFVGLLSIFKLMRSKKPGGEYYLAAILFVSNFLFFSRMHERHLMPSFAYLAIISVLDWRIVFSYIALSFTYIMNTIYSYTWIVEDFKEIFTGDLVKVFIIGNLLVFANLILQGFKKKSDQFPSFKISSRFQKKPVDIKFSDIAKNTASKLLLLILLFSAITRIFYLHQPQKEYFDEVYHAFTARQMLSGNTFAWEWWNPHPEGFAYEWTHPPMAKLIMAAGMYIFGVNQLGWRLPGAVFGVLATLLIFLISKSIFRNRSIAVLSAFIFSLEGLPLVMSRIGMNDIYFLTFMLLSIYLFIKTKNFASSISLGLAAASKWSTLWALPIFLIIHFALKKKIRLSYLWFLVMPVLVYLLSYSPIFLSPKIQSEYVENAGYQRNIDEKTGIIPLDMFIDTQKQMWWYHTNLKATHPFTSPWWSWPFLSRPVWVYTGSEEGGVVSNIYIMGNPLVFWFGIVSILVCGYYALSERNKKLGLIVFSYVVFFAPWAASPRIMFLYHYLPSVPFMVIAISYVLKRNSKYIIPVLLVFVLSFIYFYPRFSGIPVPPQLNESYRWFEGW